MSNNWKANRQILLDGLVLRAEGMKKELLAKGYPPEKLAEEVSIILLADLQEKQTSETNAMCNVISDKVGVLYVSYAKLAQCDATKALQLRKINFYLTLKKHITSYLPDFRGMLVCKCQMLGKTQSGRNPY